jgi:Ca-activated chloride channel family protein
MIDASTLTFLWPRMLWLLILLPLLVALYVGLLARRGGAADRLRHLEVIGSGGAAGRLRRHLPAVLWLLGLTLLMLAVARPQASLTVPSRLETVILALDISGSMRATDIAPTRIVAAQEAAKAFIAEQPRHMRVGIVAVASAAAVVQSPTSERDDLVQAIDRLQPQRGTALGSGLIIALDTALPQAGIEVEKFIHPRPARGGNGAPAAETGRAIDDAARAAADAARAEAGRNAAIVLLSDGQSNVGPDPLKAAAIAAEHGVRIYTVGMGTAEGATVKADGWSMRVRLDEATLRKIAALTQGEYFGATDAAELKKVYRSLSARMAFEKQRPTEVTALAVAIGALLATVAAVLSIGWFNRIL